MGLDFPHYGELLSTDVWRIARQVLKIHSNRQEAIAQLISGKSQKTRLEPNTWLTALLNSDDGERARAYILDHCKKDVKDLEKNYEKLVVFAKKSNRSI